METQENLQVGIVIPTFKEEDNISDLLNRLLKLPNISQIIVVDDSPNMKTIEAVKTVDSQKIDSIHRQTKAGRGSAVIEGVQKLTQYDLQYVIEMDADFSHSPEQIPELIQTAIENKSDLVIACRYISGSSIENWPLTRRLFSKFSNIIAKCLLNVPVNDYTNGFRLYSKKAAGLIASDCGKLGSGFIALSEILVTIYYSGLKINEVPTIFVNRSRGDSSLSRKEITNAAFGLLKIYQLKNRLKAKR